MFSQSYCIEDLFCSSFDLVGGGVEGVSVCLFISAVPTLKKKEH